MDSRKLWQSVLGELEVSLSAASFKTWFKGTGIIGEEDGHIVVAVPNIMAKNWLEKKFNPDIRNSLSRAGYTVKSIEYKITNLPRSGEKTRDPLISAATSPNPVSTQPVRTPNRAMSFGQTQAPVRPQSQTQAQFKPVPHPTLNPKYTFENFVVGSSNELAFAASQAVAAYPGEKYNPLFIYGGVGLGKTHLMQAIGNEILRRDPEKHVRYITSEQFTSEFLSSIQSKKVKSFADQYRRLDVLIVDDIQFLGNKEKTQEEFFHTFNTLHQANKQIIMSSDKPPKAIPHLEDRLRSRFEWGMAADIQRPDLETRSAIIQAKANAAGQHLSMETVELLARHFQHSIRELEGALTQLFAYCELQKQEPSLQMVKAVIGAGSTGVKRKTITAKTIIDKTAEYFDIRADEITGSKRDKEIVVPRQIAMYLMRTELNLSFPKIASSIGGRDHTTAMHSVRKIEKHIELDEDLRSEINSVKERITV